MVKFRQYRWQDLVGLDGVIEPDTPIEVEWAKHGEDWFSWTGERDGVILGCGGIVPIEGDWRGWLYLSPEARKNTKSVYRFIKTMIENFKTLPFPVLTYVRKGFPEGIRLVEHCGMKKIGEHYYGSPVNEMCWTYSTE